VAFDQSAISHVRWATLDVDILLEWDSSAPGGSIYQVYESGRLAWSGTATSCVLPSPAQDPARIEVGVVDPGEQFDDLSASLPAPPGGGRHATLKWEGGSYLAADLVGFNVYSGITAGGAVNYTTPLAYVEAYPQGIASDGYGLGGYGEGGYGQAIGSFTWRSEPLSGGTWNFAVVSVDRAGNEGTAVTTSVAINAPPLAPATNPAGLRLTYTYNATTRVPTLNWMASP